MRSLRTVSLALLAVVLTGCQEDPSKEIVAQAKRDGAGDVESSSHAEVVQWLDSKGAKHRTDLRMRCGAAKRVGDEVPSDPMAAIVCGAAFGTQIRAPWPLPNDPLKDGDPLK